MKRRTPKPRKAGARREVAAALRELAAAHRVYAAEVGQSTRVLAVLANEIAGAAHLLATEMAAVRVAKDGPADALAAVRPVRRT